jgi:hypothetical protein
MRNIDAEINKLDLQIRLLKNKRERLLIEKQLSKPAGQTEDNHE